MLPFETSFRNFLRQSSVTTRARSNRTINQAKLRFNLVLKANEWIVSRPSGRWFYIGQSVSLLVPLSSLGLTRLIDLPFKLARSKSSPTCSTRWILCSSKSNRPTRTVRIGLKRICARMTHVHSVSISDSYLKSENFSLKNNYGYELFHAYASKSRPFL
jgi:hypothetical protein